jgi:xanthine dehydrogenase YagT iron-sulfur-binding subunit
MSSLTREVDEVANAATIRFELNVNGQNRTLDLDPRTTLLDALCEHLALGGSKKGCDQGQCGACTVHINGKRKLACLSLAIAHQQDEITTIEGLADGEQLHPMQLAFVECDGFQCGYCTPGQIMSAVAMLEEAADGVPSHVTPNVSKPPGVEDLSLEEIRERMSGNICRCGAYPNIVEAIVQARSHKGAKR